MQAGKLTKPRKRNNERENIRTQKHPHQYCRWADDLPLESEDATKREYIGANVCKGIEPCAKPCLQLEGARYQSVQYIRY